MPHSDFTPVLILGGQENTLSLVRSLARRGVPVRVAAPADCAAYYSRYTAEEYPQPANMTAHEWWTELLLSGKYPELAGNVLIVGSDDGIEFELANYAALKEQYILEAFDLDVHRAMLDKQATLELAEKAGVPIPKFRNVEQLSDVQDLDGQIMFPVLIKPRISHQFARVMGSKLFVVDTQAELLEKAEQALAENLAFMVCELVPGADDLLCSHYTYRDQNGRQLLDFTKRVIRRSPLNFGGASLHVTEHQPEVAELAARFWDSIGFRGFGNLEFKRDTRDGQLKVIECNSRFTAPQELLMRAGLDVGWLVYCHLTGRPLPVLDGYRDFVWMWNPVKDIAALQQLRARGELSLPRLVREVAHRRMAWQYFDPRDPMPMLMHTTGELGKRLAPRIERLWGNR